MPKKWITFGTELRRLRTEADLSLAQLSKLVHYSKGYLSKIETGAKRPPLWLARRCDVVLGAAGELAGLVTAETPGIDLPELAADDGEVWLMNLAVGGTSWFQPMDRRDALAIGAVSLMGGFGLSAHGFAATARETAVVQVVRSVFEQIRSLGQTASPGAALPALIAQTHTLRELAAQADGSARRELLKLSARYAEYAGWMAQESGNDQAALWWTARAAEMAAAGGDHSLATYALVRRALVTLYRGDAVQTVELARRAQADQRTPVRIRGLAAQREAQGHALAGDRDACTQSLERAQALLNATSDDPGNPIIGTSNVCDPAAVVTGWCLYELGQPHEAAEILEREIARIPPHALRSRARYGIRQALAHVAAGEIDQGCLVASGLLDAVDVVSSATIATDLRRLARALSRWRARPQVRELYPRLTGSIRAPAL